jgi:hypothetical protein
MNFLMAKPVGLDFQYPADSALWVKLRFHPKHTIADVAAFFRASWTRFSI